MTARLDPGPQMTTPWRRRRMCMLIAGAPTPANLRDIDGHGAFVETSARPRLGTQVELHHPEAGTIAASVTALAADGIRIGFAPGVQAVGFALAAIAADMIRPADRFPRERF